MRYLRKHFLSWDKKTNIRIKLFIEFYYFLITHWLINTAEAHPMEFYILNFLHIFISLPKVEKRKKHSRRWKGEINTKRKRCWKAWPVHGGTLLIFTQVGLSPSLSYNLKQSPSGMCGTQAQIVIMAVFKLGLAKYWIWILDS